MCMCVRVHTKLIYKKLCHFNNYKKSNRNLHFSYFHKFLPLEIKRNVILLEIVLMHYMLLYYTIKTDLSPFVDVFL